MPGWNLGSAGAPPKVELPRAFSERNVLRQKEDDGRGYTLVGLQTDKFVNQFVDQFTFRRRRMTIT